MSHHPPLNKKVSFLIPAYQAEPYLFELIGKIKSLYPNHKIVVVNDGSTDQTEKVGKASQATVISHFKNKGKGQALLTGIRALKNSEWIICLDADLQHSPDDIPHFLTAIESDQYDLLIGQRNFSDPTMPIHRKLSNSITSCLLSARTFAKLTDGQCGFRAIRVTSFPDIDFYETGYMFETEYLIRMALSEKKIGFVPIQTVYNSSPSHIRPLGDTLKFVTLWLRSLTW